MAAAPENIDPREIARFQSRASVWWDKKGPFSALHDINPLRLAYVKDRMEIKGREILDVGCGGGILSEAMAAAGAKVIGIDLVEEALAAARIHMRTSGVAVAYRRTTAEALAEESPGKFDGVTCMELLEHIPDPGSMIRACAALVRPGGDIFIATLNRTPAAWLLAIVAAEYVLGIVEKGTHTYRKFVRPGEISRTAHAAGLKVKDVSGFYYLPVIGRAGLTRFKKVNYMMHLKKPETGN